MTITISKIIFTSDLCISERSSEYDWQFASKFYGHRRIIGDCTVVVTINISKIIFPSDLSISDSSSEYDRKIFAMTTESFTFYEWLEGGAGVWAAVFCRELLKLPDYCSVFQAKVVTAKMASNLVVLPRRGNLRQLLVWKSDSIQGYRCQSIVLLDFPRMPELFANNR